MTTKFKVGDRVSTVARCAGWRGKTVIGHIQHIPEYQDSLFTIRVETAGFPVEYISRYADSIEFIGPMTREERIAEQAALVEERERVLAETKKSLEEARKVLAELTAPEPPKVGDLASREGVVRAVIKWRLGTMVITAFQGAYPQEESDIPMVHHWSSKTGKLYSTWQEARDAS